MSFLGSLLSATFQTVLIPIEVVKDVASLGGALTDQHTPYTAQRLARISRQIDAAVDSLDDEA